MGDVSTDITCVRVFEEGGNTCSINHPTTFPTAWWSLLTTTEYLIVYVIFKLSLVRHHSDRFYLLIS